MKKRAHHKKHDNTVLWVKDWKLKKVKDLKLKKIPDWKLKRVL